MHNKQQKKHYRSGSKKNSINKFDVIDWSDFIHSGGTSYDYSMIIENTN
jgi:hypothetical protein